MNACKQEDCPNWSGDGNVCPCAVLDLDPPTSDPCCLDGACFWCRDEREAEA